MPTGVLEVGLPSTTLVHAATVIANVVTKSTTRPFRINAMPRSCHPSESTLAPLPALLIYLSVYIAARAPVRNVTEDRTT
ncbi:hypothetical protein GCM10027167_12470 [Nocardia heshunensis]